ncbi:MAG TPA: cyclic nucleotide-binding domain-containing protein [Xanthomonadaceae bacterium]|nr:cyclic nucleotide-binding domain-containing protein [Xanthomonadaceae bacterium]
MVSLSLFRDFVPTASLTPTDRADLARYSRVSTYRKGEVVCRLPGREANIAYLLKGEVEVRAGDGIRAVSAGSVAARRALNGQSVRDGMVVCKQPCEVLLVDRERLDLLLTWAQTGTVEVTELHEGGNGEDATDWMTAMLQSPAFLRVPPAHIAQLFACMQPQHFAAGETIIRQGDEGDCYFVITEGRVQVVREADDGLNEDELGQIGVGRGFGEEALLSGQPRNATVRALTRATVMRLDKKDFARLLQAPMLREIDLAECGRDTCLLDVRLPEEFAQGHLPGALNAPLVTIRDAAERLDAGRAHAVYCDTGRRSASATYLLCERGIDALLVRGGVPLNLMTETD